MRPLSPLPIHGRMLSCGQATVSPGTSPGRIVASPNVQVHPTPTEDVHIQIGGPVPSAHIRKSASHTSHGEDLLKRIDAVVSQMEQELSSDLAACVSSPEAQAAWDVTHGLEWIDRQIDAKARRREACESRQAHLADLRRLVAQRDENMATLQAPEISARSTSRLSILEDEHEELKKQVEAERLELLKVRANLQVECEERVQEAGCLAQSFQESRQHALALQQAANERSRDAANQLKMLQASLEQEKQQHRMSQEAQQLAGARVRHLEEKSQNMMAENQMLQQKIREMEMEQSAFLEVQDKSEEERRSLLSRLQEVESQRDSEIGSLQEAHSRIRSLQSEKETLSEVEAELERSRMETEEREKELREARQEAKELQQRLEHSHNAQLKAVESPTRRLSILEGGHEELRKQVENERIELHKVRANLQVECERRLQEERALAESVKENRQHALAQEAANQRLREDAQQLRLLQERLRETEANLERERQQRMSQDAHHEAGANLREENQSLQQKVRQLEVENAKLVELQVKSEEERRSLISRIQEIESQHENHLGSLQDTQSRMRLLHSEKEALLEEMGQLKSSQREKEEAEKDLLEAQTLVQQLQRKLAKQEEQVRIFEERHMAQEAAVSALESQLADEKQEASELRQQVVECQSAGQKLQLDSEAVLAEVHALQQQNEELQKSLAARDESVANAANAAAGGASRKRQKTRQQSLWAESITLPVDEDDLLPSADGFVAQVREAHQGVDRLMENGAKVHIGTITVQLELMAGKGDVQELLDSNKEIQLERGLMVNELDARCHDLQALQEKVILQHNLSSEEQEQVTTYIQRDMARCQEELEIMKLSDSLVKLPEGLIQELIHMKDEGLPGEPGYENGFTPMHWAAQHGRRDLVEFIREKVEKGSELLRSRDVQGRIPLFFAKRARRDGLAYHLSRIGGFSDLLVRSSKKRPDVEDLAPAYKKVLENIEKHSWRAMEWKGGWTMLHWAAKHGKKELCLYLLTQQANPSEKDDEGRSALDVAREANHTDLLVAFQEKLTMPRESVSSIAFTPASVTPKE